MCQELSHSLLGQMPFPLRLGPPKLFPLSPPPQWMLFRDGCSNPHTAKLLLLVGWNEIGFRVNHTPSLDPWTPSCPAVHDASQLQGKMGSRWFGCGHPTSTLTPTHAQGKSTSLHLPAVSFDTPSHMSVFLKLSNQQHPISHHLPRLAALSRTGPIRKFKAVSRFHLCY